MLHLEHENLLKPPEGTRIVVIPCIGETWAKGGTQRTPRTNQYIKAACARWPGLDINLGVLHWRRGITPHPLTLEKDGKIYFPGQAARKRKPPPYHLVSFPTRRFKAQKLEATYIGDAARALTKLMSDLPWLNEGPVVLPQIYDDEHLWEQVQRWLDPWLDDRYTAITGLEGVTS